MMVDACNPRTGEVQAKGSGVKVTLAYIERWRLTWVKQSQREQEGENLVLTWKTSVLTVLLLFHSALIYWNW